MGLFKRKKTEDPAKAQAGNPEEIDMSTGTAADVEEMMRKYDRESNTRIWEGTPQQIIRFGVAAFSLYCIIMTLVYKGMREVTLTAFLAMIVVIGYLHYPAKKGDNRVNHLPWYDIVIMLAGAGSLLYYTFNAEAIVKQAVAITENPVMVILAVVAILSLMELCRRCVGIPILCVVGAILIYTFANVRFGKVIYDLFYAKTGIMNTPIDVCAKYIVVFVIFGAFLERTGIASFFIDFANRAVGRFSGGPAKVAVIASALEGMASGSSVANTVGSGSITIPMMKRTGYRPEFAAAVEAAASTGGQIMPPIMGAAAFLMAEYVNVPYATIAVTAILPAVLYFAGIYIAVHLEAKKMGLKGIPQDQLPRWRDLLKKCYLLIPLIVLVWLVSSGSRSMATSAALATLTAVIVGLLNWIFLRDEALTFNKFVDALAAGGRSIITVASACAMAGIVAGCVTSTGLASKLITAVVAISGGNTMIVDVRDYTDLHVLGATRDDAAGECFDKVARVLGRGYPGGAPVDRLSQGGDDKKYHFPIGHVADHPYDMSFSGLKTAVINLVHGAEQRGEALDVPSLCASFSAAVSASLVPRTMAAARELGRERVAVAGGVAANSRIRHDFEAAVRAEGKQLFVPPLRLCGDNAAMIGCQGYYEYRAGHTAGPDLNAYATMEL